MRCGRNFSWNRRGQQIPPVSLRSGVGMTKGVGWIKSKWGHLRRAAESQKPRAGVPAPHELRCFARAPLVTFSYSV
jgi:hypothetical protein